MYSAEDCPNLHCGDCKYFNINGDREPSPCKKINHKAVKFYKPWFKSYDCGMNHLVCGEFEPKHPEYADIKDKWTNFADFWKVYEKVWLTNCERNGIPFVLNDDFDVMYYVPLETFLYGKVVEDGILKATRKSYLRQSRASPTGYNRITENINGVKIYFNGGTKENGESEN